MGRTTAWMMIAMLAWAGGYAVYTALRLKREFTLFDNKFLYPANCRPQDCRDVAGFILYMTPRLWIFGLACLGLALVMVLVGMMGLIPVPAWVPYFGLPGLGLLLFIWYLASNAKTAKKYW